MTDTPTAQIRVHLQTPGWGIEAALAVPTGPAPIETWLPFLQLLADKSAQSAREAAERAGKHVSCQKGCAACCRPLVAISLVEARALAQLVTGMPQPRRSEIRQRFADALARIAASGVLERDHSDADTTAEFPLAQTDQQRLGAAWFALRIACPFLEDETCGIYDQRPLVCREHQVTSPAAACARLYREPVERTEPPVRLSQSLARAAAQIAGVSVAIIPLTMALDLPAEVDAALAGEHEAVGMLEVCCWGRLGSWGSRGRGLPDDEPIF